ncbi:MAG: hypothetical protein IJB08_02705, partial [Alistipes sp.]|nr:hypothetical protein [Alistipes sp.]
MKKVLFVLMLAMVSVLTVGCDKKGVVGEKFQRHAFNAPTFAINLGEDFEEYRLANADYIIE